MWRWSSKTKSQCYWRTSILHTCGGDPKNMDILFKRQLYSPHMWRWSRTQMQPETHNMVFSTHVEVILPIFSINPSARSILHTCGGDPNRIISIMNPRTVFSTHVEVIPGAYHFAHEYKSILHTCGGDPKRKLQLAKRLKYSPHMWRWSYRYLEVLYSYLVFSTHVEVILKPLNL